MNRAPKTKRTRPKKRWKAPKETPKEAARKGKFLKRREQAVELRARGATFEMIAQACGYENPTRAYRDVMRAYRDVITPDVEAMRAENDARVQRMFALLAVPLGQKGANPELDIKRMTLARQLLKDQRELYGLDAPRRVHVEGALLQLTRDDLRAMSTTDLQHTLETGQLPATPQLRLVSAQGETKPSAPSEMKR